MKTALVCGAGGFIGGHMVKRLKAEGYWVRGVDIKAHEFAELPADEFIIGDLRDPDLVASVITPGLDEIYQFAADMGGAGYIFTGEHDAAVMHNSAMCNLNVVEEAVRKKVPLVFYSSSACIYPERIQMETGNPGLKESDAYPAGPDSEYGWEKLFSERLYLAYARNHGPTRASPATQRSEVGSQRSVNTDLRPLSSDLSSDSSKRRVESSCFSWPGPRIKGLTRASPATQRSEVGSQRSVNTDLRPLSSDLSSDSSKRRVESSCFSWPGPRIKGLNVRIARFHNIFGPEGTWTGGREKAPAAMCRKVAEAADGGEVEIWGDGEQTRTFLYIDECIEGVRRLVQSDFEGPVNIGSDELISINDLARMTAEIAGKKITLKHIEGPLGVRGRRSDNRLIEEKLGWRPTRPLREGMERTYRWVAEQVRRKSVNGEL